MTMPLCRSCKYARRSDVVGFEAHNWGYVKKTGTFFCTEFYLEIKDEATQCSRFEFHESISMRDMKEMAYILEKKNKVGFENPVFEFVKPEVKP